MQALWHHLVHSVMVIMMPKILVVGAGAVGKSSLVKMYTDKTFSKYYDPTTEEATCLLQIPYKDKMYTVEIGDTPGQEEFVSNLDLSLPTGDAFMLLFAIDSAESWKTLKEYLILIQHMKQDLEIKEEAQCSNYTPLLEALEEENRKSTAIPIIIVANKEDLDQEQSEPLKNEVIEYCNIIDVPLVMASAKTGKQVDVVFEKMIQEIYQLRPYLLESADTHGAVEKPVSCCRLS